MNSSLLPPLIIVITFSLYSVLHSISAALGFKAWLFNLWPGIERYYRLIYSIFATISLLPIFALPLFYPDTPVWTIPTPWRYFTGFIQLLAVVTAGYSVLQTGALTFIGLTQALGIKNANEALNINGLYQYMRHPLYTFSFIFIWLTPVMSLNWLTLYGIISVYLVIGAIYEERKLVVIFGQDYVAYQKKTPMFFPHPFK